MEGYPEPEVKWLKDWHPLVASSRVQILAEGPYLHSLIIHNPLQTDVGIYSAVATNVAGGCFSLSRKPNSKPKLEPTEAEATKLFCRTKAVDESLGDAITESSVWCLSLNPSQSQNSSPDLFSSSQAAPRRRPPSQSSPPPSTWAAWRRC